jgi:hypothetical protein
VARERVLLLAGLGTPSAFSTWLARGLEALTPLWLSSPTYARSNVFLASANVS